MHDDLKKSTFEDTLEDMLTVTKNFPDAWCDIVFEITLYINQRKFFVINVVSIQIINTMLSSLILWCGDWPPPHFNFNILNTRTSHFPCDTKTSPLSVVKERCSSNLYWCHRHRFVCSILESSKQSSGARGGLTWGISNVWDHVTRYVSKHFVNLDPIIRIKDRMLFQTNVKKCDNIDYSSPISDIDLIDYAF